MIEKIVEISNVGHFVNFKLQGSQKWNGQLKKLNIIYAPNGSGKTTLSTILKSLSQNNIELIKFKKTFGTTAAPSVKIKQYNNSQLIALEDLQWTSNNLKIEVFDINYIEDYLFAGSYNRRQNKTNLFKLLLGQKGTELKNKLRPLINAKERLVKKLSDDKRNIALKEEINICQIELDKLLTEFDNYADPIFNKHVEVVNKYLEKFTSYITLSEFSFQKNTSDFERFRIFPIFEVYEEQVVFSSPALNNKIGNARYSMSEGDKSTIALCFFLARLEIVGISDKIIIFDDPLSSFDYSRRTSTIFQLSKIAKAAVQFILLTHDLSFAADFSDKCAFLDQLTLKIENNTETSFLAPHDINAEFLTSTQKDIEVIKHFLKHSANSDYDKREVIRCIRPVLEGVFKSKYFDTIPNKAWLGDIIDLVRKSTTGDRLHKLTALIEDVVELNDYTKSYHHNSGNGKSNTIDNEELRRYVNLLMKTIDKI